MSLILSFDEIVSACQGELKTQIDEALPELQQVAIDTRTISKPALFVALKGERANGHDYLEQAREQGAVVALVEDFQPVQMTQIKVDDCQKALVAIAKATRAAFQGKVSAITGSSGKTSTKEALVALLKPHYWVSFTQGNQNNELGVPLTLVNLDANAEQLVLEMGARKPGDIKALMEIASPDVAMITNIGVAHIEIFGSQEQIFEAKSEIYQGLDNGGVAIINRDDPFFEQLEKKSAHVKKSLSFSIEDALADVYASDVVLAPESTKFCLHYQDVSVDCSINQSGKHALINVLAASACALVLGVQSLDELIKGMSDLSTISGRNQVLNGNWGGSLIDDSYNANPLSTKAAIDLLALYDQRKILVLGDMGELGNQSTEMHQEVLQYACDQHIDEVLVSGFRMQQAAKQFERIRAFDSLDHLLVGLKMLLKKDDVVLLKGSRSEKLEQLIPPLTNESENSDKETAKCS
ncbi:MAG: UDP-N-acetylmuramoyl-tripeptide--D-alanyl-D-alanine ligase [Cellvibrionales bacterium]|nr:UDP-N-acetylmuramoyl-tripeptide--D-alanyl-D-alanine ligase [Cellvibrionales bacterium]